MTVVGLLHPGAMGAALGAQLREAGHDVVWASAGRSADTARRAADAGLRDAGTIESLTGTSDLVLSVCPPHAARDVAAQAAGRVALFVDANAVSPATAREVAAAIAGAGGRAIDGGLIGPPPGRDTSVSLLLSGVGADDVARLFDGTRVRARVVGTEIGAASATKMAYAGWTKGSAALLLAVRGFARAEGVEEALARRVGASATPSSRNALRRRARGAAGKAWRWVGEMEEIAASLAAAGLPRGFHEAAAELYERLAAGSEADLDAVLHALSVRYVAPGSGDGPAKGDTWR